MNGNHLKSHACVKEKSDILGVCLGKEVRDPYREELKVAVADDVEHVEAEKVDVEHSNACTADSPCSQQGNSKVGSVHQVLHEGVHGSCDGLGNERSVVVRVVFLWKESQ
jgi:hypothetical protein